MYKDRCAPVFQINKATLAHDWALQIHGFYVDMEEKTMRFDVVLSFDVDAQEAICTLMEEVQKLYPDYALQIIPDI